MPEGAGMSRNMHQRTGMKSGIFLEPWNACMTGKDGWNDCFLHCQCTGIEFGISGILEYCLLECLVLRQRTGRGFGIFLESWNVWLEKEAGIIAFLYCQYWNRIWYLPGILEYWNGWKRIYKQID